MAQIQVPQAVIRTPLQVVNFALSTVPQSRSPVLITTVGEDITGIDLELSVSVAGTLSTPAAISQAIQQIVISDSSNVNIAVITGTALLTHAKILSPKGYVPTMPTASNSAQSFNTFFNLPIKMVNQPVTIQVTFNPYSSLAASGATGATVTLTLNVVYGAALTNTHRISTRTSPLVAGDNYFNAELPDGKTCVAMAINLSTESDLSHITFSPDGNKDSYSSAQLQTFIDIENATSLTSHITGIANLFVTPFVINITKTSLNFNAGSADSGFALYIYTVD